MRSTTDYFDQVCGLRDAGVFDLQDLTMAHSALPYCKDLPELPLVAAWTSRWTRQGHICLPASNTFAEGIDIDLDWTLFNPPDLNSWIEKVPDDHPFISDGQRITPLVFNPNPSRLYLHRWYRAEQRVAQAVQDRISAPPTLPKLPDDAEQRLNAHFQDEMAASQKNAVRLALQHSFSLITGGPGTGKTSTLLKLIDLFQSCHGRDVQIALCAPTGKAVSRMEESIRAQGSQSSDPDLQAIAEFKDGASIEPPRTIHRLLGYSPLRGTCRYNRDNPLPYKLIIVDESSMIDLLLMNELVLAVADGACLTLVGDKNQLPAVGTGALFSDLCATPALSGFTAVLDVNWRAKDAPALCDLADAVNSQNDDDVFALLQRGDEGVQWSPDTPIEELLASHALPHWKKLKQCHSPDEAFALMREFQLLCAVRRGPRGVHTLNARAIEMLGESRAPFHGMPLLITANDYQHRLFNGDAGIFLEMDGRLQACFETSTGYRTLDLSRLPAHDPLYACTIHKSQGSEASRILVALPDEDSVILSCELLYTAITRARRMVLLCASQPILQAALSRKVQRVSSLPDRITASPR